MIFRDKTRYGMCAMVIGAVSVLAIGCDPDIATLDGRDLDMPIMKRANERVEVGDVDSAVRLYLRALEEDPSAARGHLDVALLLDDYKQDYVRAIYHYRRYLELREGTEKSAMIEERIRRAEHLFAAGIVVPTQQSEVITRLEKENASLNANIRALTHKLAAAQSELAELRKGVADPDRGNIAAVTSRVDDPPAAADRPKTYTVQPGDSLTRIAETFYGDPKRWLDIHAENKTLLGRSTNVKAGQVLKLP